VNSHAYVAVQYGTETSNYSTQKMAERSPKVKEMVLQYEAHVSK